MADPTCPACGAVDCPATGERHDPYAMHRCPSCDLVFADPCRNPGPEFYDTLSGYEERASLGTLLAPAQNLFLEIKPLGRALIDLGCGTGELLAQARERGYEVAGIEFGHRFSRYAQERLGLEVHRQTPEEFAALHPGRKFDVVSFFEVLEHNHPVEWMKGVKLLLKPGGYIALSIPNRERYFETIKEGDDPPHHLTRWTRPCLRRFLEAQGFEIITMTSPVDRLNIAHHLRNTLRFGLASKLSPPVSGSSAPPASSAVAAAVGMKEKLLNIAAYLPYWLFHLWPDYQGSNLFCVARLKG